MGLSRSILASTLYITPLVSVFVSLFMGIRYGYQVVVVVDLDNQEVSRLKFVAVLRKQITYYQVGSEYKHLRMHSKKNKCIN